MVRISRVFSVTGVLFLTFTCFSVPADIGSFPLGHLKITDGENGTINIEARCVAAKDLLEKIAGLKRQTVRFEKSCLTYVNVWRPDQFEQTAFWMNHVASAASASTMHCHLEGDVWQVRTLRQAEFDASLDEQQIKETYPVSPVAAQPSKGGITSGFVVVSGAIIPPPYILQVTVQPDTSAELRINDVPILDCPPISKSEKKQSLLPPSKQFARPEDIRCYVSGELYPSLIKDLKNVDTALDRVEEFLKGQEIVGQVLRKGRDHPWPDTPSSSELMAISKEGKSPWPVFLELLNLETGQYLVKPYPPQNVAEDQSKEILEMLKYGYIVFVDPKGVLLGVPSAENLVAAINACRTLSLLQAECVLGEVIKDRRTARQAAVHFLENPDDVVTILRQAHR